jgi:addiction module HigA family antidote
MRMKSKSPITTEQGAEGSTNAIGGRRLPEHRPPTHPGEMLLEEFLKPLGITQSEFAIRLGVSFPRLNEIIRGKRSVTTDTALRLARVLGVSADVWLGLQQDWDLWHAMRSDRVREIDDLEPLYKVSPDPRKRGKKRE